MRFSYNILPERRLNLLRFSGSISLADIKRATEQFWADARFHPEYTGVADMSDIVPRVKIEDLKALLEYLETNHRSVGRWVVILTEPKPTALALIFKAAFRGRFQLEVVSSWSAAAHFLQMELPEPLVGT